MADTTQIPAEPQHISWLEFAVRSAAYLALFSLFFLTLGWTLKPEDLALVQIFLGSSAMSAVALMALGVHVLGVLILGTFSTARDGEMLGTQWSSLWVPIRTSILATLFLPVVDTGNGSISLLADAGLWLLQLTA